MSTISYHSKYGDLHDSAVPCNSLPSCNSEKREVGARYSKRGPPYHSCSHIAFGLPKGPAGESRKKKLKVWRDRGIQVIYALPLVESSIDGMIQRAFCRC